MGVMTGTRSGEDPKRIEHTLMGPRREDARQGGQIRGRSRRPVRIPGEEPVRGLRVSRCQRGSDVKLRSEAGLTVIVPMHRELAPGTLRSIIRQSNLDVDRFVSLLR